MEMTKRKLAAEICKREGGKSQARIGDVMQIIGLLFEVLWELDYQGDTVRELQLKASRDYDKKKMKEQKLKAKR